MKTIGIKLADGSFYPILQEGEVATKSLNLTTVSDNQTTVHVDVYRSETGTMEDAEYVDTLEIKNLKPHENGKPSLNLDIGLNENNELTAEITDPETGRSSETQVTLVSRTLSEASNPIEFNNDPTLSEAVSEESMIGPSPNDEDFSFEDVNEKLKKDPADEANSESDIFSSEELNLPEFGDTNPQEEILENQEEPLIEESVIENTSDPILDENAIDESELILNVPQDESVEEIEVNADDADDATASDDFAATSDSTSTDDLLNDLPDFDATENAETSTETSADTENFDLPDFNDTVADETVTDTFDSTAGETDSTGDTTDDIDEFSLPDFNDDSSDSIEPVGLGGVFDDDFGEPNLSSEDSFNLPEDEPTTKDPTFQPNDAMFSGLYDQETMNGTSSAYNEEDEDDEKKKTRAPVIICIVCAIICVIAVLLILFVIPSKFNLLKKGDNSKSCNQTTPAAVEETLTDEEPVAELDEPVTEIEIAQPVIEQPAQEDTIVVAETPEVVVPELPPAPAEKPADIKYKIKWGDTLWDISQAYYKNPWRYKMLARYNGIKNPDHIISGTWILIPAE